MVLRLQRVPEALITCLLLGSIICSPTHPSSHGPLQWSVESEPQNLGSTRSNIAFWVQFCVLWPDGSVALAPNIGKRLVQMLFVNRLQMWAVQGELRLDRGCPAVPLTDMWLLSVTSSGVSCLYRVRGCPFSFAILQCFGPVPHPLTTPRIPRLFSAKSQTELELEVTHEVMSVEFIFYMWSVLYLQLKSPED